MSIEQRFLDQAARQLIAEDDQRFLGRVRERALALQGEAYRIERSDFPTDRDAGLALIAQLEVRQAALQRKPAHDRSASEDDESDGLVRRLGEMRKRARTLGWLPKEAAAA